MFVGTLFTLFVVPSIYMLVAKDHRKDREQNTELLAAAPES
jgi:multidrug efflux pump